MLSSTCVLGHVVLQLRCPLAFVATDCTEIFLLFFVNPHVKLENINNNLFYSMYRIYLLSVAVQDFCTWN